MKNNIIVKLIKEGYTASEIVEKTGKKNSGVYATAKRHGLILATNQNKNIETLICPQCGKEFTAKKYENRKYCSRECLNQANRGRKLGFDEDKTIGHLLQKQKGWGYIGGYTGSEGSAVIRHECGYTDRYSCITIRNHPIRCMMCYQKEQERKQKVKADKTRKEKETKRFYRKIPKYEQISMRECPVCGQLFMPDGKRKYCSEECSNQSIKHYQNMKKRRRARKAWTEESKGITLKKLYERDGGICWICGEKCDYSADPNSNFYPSIDHVVRIADGGMDRWDNVKLAHRVCNSQRNYIPSV